MCENYSNGDDYIVAGFELYASELDKFRKLCLKNGDLAQFIEKALRAYLKRSDTWAPTQDIEGPRTLLYVRLPKNCILKLRIFRNRNRSRQLLDGLSRACGDRPELRLADLKQRARKLLSLALR